MALSTTINYDTPANFTYDSDLIEVLTSAKLKALVYASETFYNNCSQTTALRGGGTLAASAGAATISSGRLACLAGAYLEYASADNFTSSTVGCVRFKYTPNYTGSPASNMYIFEVTNGVTGVNSIQINHLTSGNLQLKIINSAGSDIVSATYSWTPTSGFEYFIHLNFDVTTGDTKLYINGAAVITSSATGTRTTAGITSIQIGRYVTTPGSNFYIDGIQIFSAIQTVEALWGDQYVYSIANPSIVVASGVTTDALSSFLATVVETGADAVKFTLVNGNELYWDGAAWSVASGTYAESNTAADILANIAALDISSGAIIKIKAYLHSDDGYSTPELTSASLEYDFYALANAISSCSLYAYIYDNSSPVLGAKIVIKSRTINYSQANFNKTSIVEYTDVNGYFERQVFKAGSDTLLSIEISFTNSRGEPVLRKFDVRITTETFAALDDIIVS